MTDSRKDGPVAAPIPPERYYPMRLGAGVHTMGKASLALAVRNERLLVWLLLGVAAARLIWMYVHYLAVPTSPSFDSGWYNWTDQSRYYRSSLAWARLDLNPAQHWYLPAYPLIGAVFVLLGFTDPFFVPNFGCFLLTAWLMTRLAQMLVPQMPLASIVGAFAFLVTSAVSFGGKAWIEPWTTTLLTPLLYLLLLTTIRFGSKPTPSYAVANGVIWGAIAMTRPTEAIWTAFPCIIFCAVSLIVSPTDRRTKLVVAAGGVLSAAAMLALLLTIHLSIYGWSLGSYITDSLGTGFERRLIPVRWVTLVLNPGPTHRDAGPGIATRFWWLLPGLAGMLAAMLMDIRQRRVASLLVGTTVIVHWLVYLSYRDLHPEGLWRFGNYHYFKWTQPILGFYAVAFMFLLFGKARWNAIAAACLVGFLCCWRVTFRPADYGADNVHVLGPREIAIGSGLPSPDLALIVKASGGFEEIYSGQHGLEEGGRAWSYNNDMKAWPVPGGLALSPLRPLPPGEARVTLDPGIVISSEGAPVVARQRLSFGWPWRR